MAVVKTDASTHVPSEISDDAQMTLFRAFPTTQQQVFYLGTVDVSVDEDEISNGRLWLCSLSIHSILYTEKSLRGKVLSQYFPIIIMADKTILELIPN